MASLTATAPLVGRHTKSQSLASFDPLLRDEIMKSASPMVLSPTGDGEAPEEESPETSGGPLVTEEQLAKELRAIASELGKASSPNRSLMMPTQGELDQAPPRPEPPREDSFKGKPPRTPPSLRLKRSPSKRNNKNIGKDTIDSNNPPAEKRGLWGRRKSQHAQHQRTKSMPLLRVPWSGNKKPSQKITNRASHAPTHSRTSSKASLSSDMLQELWELHEQAELGPNAPASASSSPQGTEVSVPSLAKPRPTSFLTGKEVVLSSEADATDWQLEIPVKTEFTYTMRASSFLENYRAEKEGVLDLNYIVGCTSQDLAQFAGGKPSPTTLKLGETHRPVVESLLECGTDLLQVAGYLRSVPVGDSSNFREILILERQRQFLCVFRGTNLEQNCKNLERQPETIKLGDNKNVSVFADRCRAFQELEPALFGKLDQLMEDNPFCDFVFSGHGFGGAMATLAAYRYAWARPELRVAALATASPKVGLSDFRLSANSLPNLKLVRVELGNPRPRNDTHGVHAGHTIRMNPGKNAAPIKAYKFADAKVEQSPMRGLRFNNKEKTLADYVDALEDLGDTWAKDFYRQDGAGVKGKDNETRMMV